MVEGIPGAPPAAGLVDRVKAILLKPKEEWPRIAADPATPGDVVTRYAIPLIAIGPVASFIGGQLFGYSNFFYSYTPGLFAGLVGAVTSFVVMLLVLLAVTFIAEFLAPKFGGEANRRQALKWVAFGATASWVGGVFGLVPPLAVLGFFASLYSLYLFYLGASPMMKIPEDKAIGFTAATAVSAVVMMIIVGSIIASVTAIFSGGASLVGGALGDDEVSGEVTIPGLGTIDADRVERAAQRAEQMANGEIKPLTASQLTPLLPESIGAYARVATSSTSMGMGSQAEGTYEAGDRTFKLRVIDMAAMGGLAGVAGAMGVEHSEENADGYERVSQDGDRMITEKWSNSGSSGTYGVVVDDRFMIEADGEAASIDELKAAVGEIDEDDLVDLAG
jgi:hypothetical protein